MRNWIFPLVFAALTVLLTFPLVLHMPTYVADVGDPLLNTWAVAWGQHALLQPWSAVRDLLSANGFYPYPFSLAFSEHLLPYAALTLPLRALQLGPVFAHNAAFTKPNHANRAANLPSQTDASVLPRSLIRRSDLFNKNIYPLLLLKILANNCQ